MDFLKKHNINIRIASNKSTFVVGSDSKKSKGEIINIGSVSKRILLFCPKYFIASK